MCKILLVDDGDDLDVQAELHLAPIGHEIVRASNGLEALNFLKEHEGDPPCIVLTDLRMPVLDGWDLVYAIRAQPNWTDLPVIVCSGLIKPDAAPPLLRAKAYWTRQPSPDQWEHIHQYCPRHHRSWPPVAMPALTDEKAAG